MNCQHFNGWDWSELPAKWGVYMPESYSGKDMYEYAEKRRLNPTSPYPEVTVVNEDGSEDAWEWETDVDWSTNDYENFDEFDPVLWFLDAVMKSYQGQKETRVMRKVAHDIRCYAAKLSESQYSYYTPLWRGLSEIESDFTVIQLITGQGPLLANMWD